MNLLKLSLVATLSVALLPTATLRGQTATTDPVGYVSYTVNANSDQVLGAPMVPASVFQGQASSVSGSTVTTSGGLPALSGANYLLVTSGNASGSWVQIASASGSDLVLAEPIAGFAASDEFLVRPFWTLSSLFPPGSGFPQSSDPFNASGILFLYDPNSPGVNQASSASYFYYDGSLGGDAGWYVNGDPGAGLQNDVIISPEVSLTIRNSTASAASISITGGVPVDSQAINIVRRSSGPQDNKVYNQFPAAVTLGESDLVSSGAVSPSSDPFNPTDILFTYALNNSGVNPASEAAYFYYDGSLGGDAGWYINGDPGAGLQNNVSLPAGAAFIIRKSAGADSVTQFNPALPYNLN